MPSSHDTRGPAWHKRLNLYLADTQLTREQAMAYLEVVQRPECLVREGARGPRGGRGRMHYNVSAQWPPGWVANRHDQYWVVVEIYPLTLPETEDEADERGERPTVSVWDESTTFKSAPQGELIRRARREWWNK